MSRMLSYIAIPLGILVSLKYFGVYDINTAMPYDIMLIGALFLMIMQLFTHIQLHISNKGTSAMEKIIKTIIVLPGILYAINFYYPISVGFDFRILIGIFLFVEGIYGLH